jgi:glycosyltransferase involved in cell wall biosynthesis
MDETDEIIISILFPCLNEQDAIGLCIEKARKFLNSEKISGEIIVVDNGSTDRSVEIAVLNRVTVISEPIIGYGSAIKKGISVSKGKIILIVDADDSYDIFDAKLFIELLNGECDFVIGSRLRGAIEPNAMPWLHQYIGVPILTWILAFFICLDISDAHCGFRAIKQTALEKMTLQCNGMEFASEMLLEASKNKLIIREIPISYKSRIGVSKLRTIRDGFRHLFLIAKYSLSSLRQLGSIK